MTKIKNTGAAKNTEAVASIQKEDITMKKNYEANAQKLSSMDNKYVDLKKKDKAQEKQDIHQANEIKDEDNRQDKHALEIKDDFSKESHYHTESM